MKVHLITIGDEILIGQIIDSNSAFIGQQLTKFGFEISEISSISDDRNQILSKLKQASAQADIIITTGGLGPTKDDITKETFAEFFGTEMVLNHEALAQVKHLFETVLKRKTNKLNRRQALLPKGTEALANPIGTAPGMWTEFNGKIYINLPGIPMEMKKLMNEQVIPKLREKFNTPIILQRHILVVNIPESELSMMLENWEENLMNNGIKFAYLPNGSRVRIRLTTTGKNEKFLTEKLNNAIQDLHSIIGENILSIKGESIEELIKKELTKKNLTLTTAESCTGGTVSKMLTSISGSSAYFKGSIVSYATEIKQSILAVSEETILKNTVVSEEVALAMANCGRAKLNSDICIATTGVAGPNKGEDGKEVGTVWIAIVTNEKEFTKQLKYPNLERNDWIDLVAKKSLEFLYETLK